MRSVVRSIVSRKQGLLIWGAARRVLRRIGTRYHPGRVSVPKLAVTQNSPRMSPTAWFICPDFGRPSGGIRKLYRSVDILNDAGFQAVVVHKQSGFRCTWFEHRTQVLSCGEVTVSPRDVIVVPEVYGASIRDLPRGVRQVIFNQNTYLMLDSLAEERGADAPYIENPDLVAVLVVSEDNARVVEYAFPNLPVHRVRQGVDVSLHHPPMGGKYRRIAYMPRRRGHEAVRVLELLRRRGVLDGWEVITIDQRSEAEVANLLRTSRIFLSFSQLEGFGLPPFEALACGCLVVGYHGFGGREFFQEPFAIAVEDGNTVAFARAVENAIRRFDNDPANMEVACAAGARFVQEHYSLEAERQDLLGVFMPLLKS